MQELGLGPATLACSSFNNGFWVYSPVNFELRRLDEILTQTVQTFNLNQITGIDIHPNFMVEHQNWMYLNNPTSKDGLLIVADSLLSMSAWPYTEENIQNAKHTNKLKDAGFITLNIDLIQMGVGGNDSWSDVAAPLEKYQVPAKNYQYSFYIVPFNAKNKSAGERAKEIKF